MNSLGLWANTSQAEKVCGHDLALRNGQISQMNRWNMETCEKSVDVNIHEHSAWFDTYRPGWWVSGIVCGPTLNTVYSYWISWEGEFPGSLEHVETTSKPMCLAIRHLQIEKQQNSIEPTWPMETIWVCRNWGGIQNCIFMEKMIINHDQPSIILGNPLSHKPIWIHLIKINF